MATDIGREVDELDGWEPEDRLVLDAEAVTHGTGPPDRKPATNRWATATSSCPGASPRTSAIRATSLASVGPAGESATAASDPARNRTPEAMHAELLLRRIETRASGSTPSDPATRIASSAIAICAENNVLFMSLASEPAPTPPRWTTLFDI